MFRSVLWKVPFWSMLRNPGFPKQGHDLVVTDHSPEPNPGRIVCHSSTGSSEARNHFRGTVSHRAGHDKQDGPA